MRFPCAAKTVVQLDENSYGLLQMIAVNSCLPQTRRQVQAGARISICELNSNHYSLRKEKPLPLISTFGTNAMGCLPDEM